MADLGYVPASSTIYLYFTTHAQTGASVAPASAYEAADVQLYKNNSATQRSSTAGWTMTSPFDSITGLHVLTIDLSDNTDAGFYAAGNQYTAVLSADTETVDGLTVVAVIGTFFIGPVQADVRQFGGTAGTFASGRPEVNTTHIAGSSVSTSSAQLGVNVVNFGGSAGTFASGRPEVNTSHIAGSAVSTASAQIGVNVVNAAGTAWGSGAITAASIAADAITAAKIADGAIDAATFAAGAINAAAIAADAIGASELAADAVTEIQSGLSTLTQANIRTAVGLGSANLDTQLAAIQADTDDIQTRIPAALTGGGNIKADVIAVSGDTVAADTLEALMDGNVVAQVNDAGATSTVFITTLTEATNDHYKGRLITFLTGTCAGQQTAITGYNGGTKALTVTAMTEAPASNDFFVMT